MLKQKKTTKKKQQTTTPHDTCHEKIQEFSPRLPTVVHSAKTKCTEVEKNSKSKNFES